MLSFSSLCISTSSKFLHLSCIIFIVRKKKQVFILKDTKICEMNDVLHLDSLLLLSWSTEVNYIISIISQLGLCDLFLDYYKILLAGPLPTLCMLGYPPPDRPLSSWSLLCSVRQVSLCQAGRQVLGSDQTPEP